MTSHSAVSDGQLQPKNFLCDFAFFFYLALFFLIDFVITSNQA